MNLSTSVRLLAGATLVASCAVVPFWLTRPSRGTPSRRTVVLPSAFDDPYEAEDPAAHWMYSRRHGALLRYDGTELAPDLADAWEREVVITIPVPAGRSQEEVVKKLESTASRFSEWGFSCRPIPPRHVRIRVADLADDDRDLRNAVKDACGFDIDASRVETVRRPRVEARYVFRVREGSKLPDGVPVPFRDRTAAATVAADSNLLRALGALPGFVPPLEIVDPTHVRIRTRRPSPDFERQIRSLCPGVFGETREEQILTLRTRRPGGDPAPAVDFRNTLGALRKHPRGRYRALTGVEVVRADAREIVLRSSRIDAEILEACTVPLAGDDELLSAPSGVAFCSADGSGDVVEGLRSGRYSAAFLVDPPGDLASVGPRFDVVLGAIVNARIPSDLRRSIAEVLRGKQGRLSAMTLRILCRRSEPVSRETAVSLCHLLRTAGARGVVESENGRDFHRRTARRDFDIVVDAFPGSIESEPRRWWRIAGSANLSGLAEPELDGLLDELGRTFEEGERFRLQERIRIRLEQSAAWVVLHRGSIRLAGTPDALDLVGVPDR